MPKIDTFNKEISALRKKTGYPQKWPKYNLCPCCQSRNIKYYFKKFSYTHWICNQCKFVFLNPFPNESTSNDLYNGFYFNAVRKYISIPKAKRKSDKANTSMNVKYYYEIVDYICQKKQNGSWLDVGGGIGTFLDIVRKRSDNKFDLYLNESNQISASFAKKYYGLKVLTKSAKEISKSSLRFDIITANAVLEHVPYPFTFISEYFKLLKAGGLLLLNIPHYTTLNRILSKQHSPNVIPPSHINFFNKKNIYFMINRLNRVNKVKIWDTGPTPFSFVHLLKISESYHIKIPSKESQRVECQIKEKLNISKLFFAAICCLLNLFSSKVIAMIDGGVYMNISITKK